MRREKSYLQGDDFKNSQARKILPILIKRAEMGQPLTYTQLAERIGYKTPRIFGSVLGHLADTLKELGNDYGLKIPPIQCIVIDKKNGIPGKGIGFLSDPNKFNLLNKEQKKNLIEKAIFDISTFKKWHQILDILKIKPLEDNFENEINKAKRNLGGEAESEDHKRLKRFIANNPDVLGLNIKVNKSETEYRLSSGDKIDVMLYCQNNLTGIEVKSGISSDADHTRGIFQCIKYKAVLSAEQFISDKESVDCLLVCESRLNESNKHIANLLNVRVIEEIKTDR